MNHETNESSDTDGTLLIEDGFQCELERFISAPAASIVCPAIMFWFQKEDENLTGEKEKEQKTEKRADVVSNSTHGERQIFPRAAP